MKKMSSRQVLEWFAPLRKALSELKTGEVYSISDFAVSEGNGFVRTDFLISGWVRCLSRLFPAVDIGALRVIERRLTEKELLELSDINSALRVLKRFELPLIKTPWARIKQISQEEQIAIEFESMQAGA